MQTHIAAVVPEDGTPFTHVYWSDGAWVSFNAETKAWANHGYVPHPATTPDRFGIHRHANAPETPYWVAAEVAVDD